MCPGRIPDSARRKADSLRWKRRLHRERLECRECEVICERVVFPFQCLRSRCSAVYAYEEGDSTYFGCVHKVFAAELDLAAFTAARRPGICTDPYGPLKVQGTPRPECPVAVEQAYEQRPGMPACNNPTFFHQPVGPAAERIRLFERGSSDAAEEPFTH